MEINLKLVIYIMNTKKNITSLSYININISFSTIISFTSHSPTILNLLNPVRERYYYSVANNLRKSDFYSI